MQGPVLGFGFTLIQPPRRQGENVGTYPDCNFPLQNIDGVLNRITHAITNRSAYSFIRIGDGEGHLLSLCERSTLEDLYYFHNHFGADKVSYQALISLKEELRRAVENADTVGLRDDVLNVVVEPSWFSLPPSALERNVKKHFRLRPVDMSLDSFSYRRLAFVNQAISRIEFAPDARFTSAWAHWDLLVSGYLYRLINQQKQVGLVTSHNALSQMVEELFSLTTTTYLVPNKFNTPPPVASGAHYPKRFERLRDELQVEFPGMLFLVGAGLCGKVYCQWIKDRGGIGLDLGSVMDTWVGLNSRPMVMADRFSDMPKQSNVPEDLLLNRENVDRLLARAEAEIDWGKIP